MIYTKEGLLEQAVKISTTQLMGQEKLITVEIPKHFILTERVRSKCSLSSGEIIQHIMMSVFGVESPLFWYNENSSGGLTIPCKPSMTDTHHVYEFHIKLRQNSSEKMEALL